MNDNVRLPLSKQLSKNTKLYVLLAATIVVVAFLTNGSSKGLLVGSLAGLGAVTLVDYSQLQSRKHPKTWRYIKAIVIGLIILLSLTGFLN